MSLRYNMIIYLIILISQVNPLLLKQLNCVTNIHNTGDCIINCSTQNCTHKLIDAKKYKSLSILCIDNPNDSTCEGTEILCPINGICNVNCELQNGCSNMHIYADGHYSQFQLDCAQYSCINITVNASNIDTIFITAIGANAMSLSDIFAENVNEFILNCGVSGITSKVACLQNNLYVPSITEDNGNTSVSINCYGESCRGSSIHVLHGMDGININIFANCQCENDINKCANYWYLFCEQYYNTESEFGYVTFRNYKCLTDNISKCDCNVMQEYVLNTFENEVCDDSQTNVTLFIESDENDVWGDILNDIKNEKMWTWVVLGATLLIVLVLFCYLCKVKMNKYNEIQLLRTFDPDELEQNDDN